MKEQQKPTAWDLVVMGSEMRRAVVLRDWDLWKAGFPVRGRKSHPNDEQMTSLFCKRIA